MSELAHDPADFSPEYVAQDVERCCQEIADTLLEEAILRGPTNLGPTVLLDLPDVGLLTAEPKGRGAMTYRFQVTMQTHDRTFGFCKMFDEVYVPDPEADGHRKLGLVPEERMTVADVLGCPWKLDRLHAFTTALHDGYMEKLCERECAKVSDIAEHIRQRQPEVIGEFAIKHAG